VSSRHRVVAVVVTWNRAALLREALAALDGQTVRPDRVVVVDNASTDGTEAVVEASDLPLDVVRLLRNVGGAGGFAAGIERAVTAHACDYVWLLDDDTVPEPTALAELLSVACRCAEPPTLLASRVVWTDGRDHPMNTPREKPWVSGRERECAAAVGAVAIRSASFVSVLCAVDAIRDRGLPIADYFLWNDDFEYTTRLLRGRTGLYCPGSVVVHKTKTFGAADADPGARFYYEVRNKLWLFTRSRSLAPLERAAYVGATLRRWVRTVLHSSDRGVLYRAFVRGFRDGLRAGPRDNREVLAA
jgi:GT2 family glycosyltransferase